MKYYIAYGSNLNIGQMSRRCPGCIPIGTGLLDGWKLVFRAHANIEKSQGDSVPVGVWEITDSDEFALDRYEGYPGYYRKQSVTMTLRPFIGEPSEITAMVYVMHHFRPIIPPTTEYYRTIADGYDDFGLDTKPLIDALKASLITYNYKTKG